MKTAYLHEINLTVKYQKLKRGSFFHLIILTTLFRDGSLYVLAILKNLWKHLWNSKTRYLIKIGYIANNENSDKLLTFWLVYLTDFAPRIDFNIAYNLIWSKKVSSKKNLFLNCLAMLMYGS